jgi:hypothetical protein
MLWWEVRAMTEAEWLGCDDPQAMVMFIEGNSNLRQLRLAACACCRRIWSRMDRRESRSIVELVEAVADGRVSELQLPSALEEHRMVPGKLLHLPNFAAVHTAYAMPRALAVVLTSTADATSEPATERREQSRLLRDIFGNPFRPATFDPAWRTPTVVTLARQMYESRDFGAMPILADALQDAGCDSDDVLAHCRGPGPHVRGCWVVDLVLGRE